MSSLITSKQNQFTPTCPHCGQPMQLIPGQKSGAWRCVNDGGENGEACKSKGGEWWDKLGSEDYLRPKTAFVNENSATDLFEPLLNPIQCSRCLADMYYLEDNSWVCPDCMSQYFPEGTPVELVEKTVDQKIKCLPKSLMKQEGMMLTSPKSRKKGSKNKSGKNHGAKKVTTPFEAVYSSIVRNAEIKKKGA
jgi:hypothetical protein